MFRRLFCVVMVCLVAGPVWAAEGGEVFRLGMIGLDTSHVIAFTRLLNDPQKDFGCKVVAGYPGGSPDIPSSANRVGNYTKQLREEFGLAIVDSIEELCRKVDGVLLESVDGRPHLEQVRPVIAARVAAAASGSVAMVCSAVCRTRRNAAASSTVRTGARP